MEHYDEGDRYFAVPIKHKYALFRFKPYDQIVDILETFNIPYEMFDNRDDLYKGRRFKVVSSKQQKVKKYTVIYQSNRLRPFLFTSDIIDKILDTYNVKYQKEDI